MRSLRSRMPDLMPSIRSAWRLCRARARNTGKKQLLEMRLA